MKKNVVVLATLNGLEERGIEEVDGVGDVGVWGESTLGGIKDSKDVWGNGESTHWR